MPADSFSPLCFQSSTTRFSEARASSRGVGAASLSARSKASSLLAMPAWSERIRCSEGETRTSSEKGTVALKTDAPAASVRPQPCGERFAIRR